MSELTKFEVRSSSGSWDTCIRGNTQNWAVPDTPARLFVQNVDGLLFGWTLLIYWPNLTFVALTVPEIIGVSPKWAVPGYAHASYFVQKFWWAFVRMNPVNVLAKLEVRSFTRSWDSTDYSSGRGLIWLSTPNRGEEEAIRGRGW